MSKAARARSLCRGRLEAGRAQLSGLRVTEIRNLIVKTSLRNLSQRRHFIAADVSHHMNKGELNVARFASLYVKTLTASNRVIARD